MKLSAKFVRSQLALFKNVITETSLEASRKGQNTLGRLLARMGKDNAELRDFDIDGIPVSLASPKDELSSGIILYLHGGGYVCGNLDFALAFGSVLAEKCGMRVFCAAYRLAPEHKAPAALNDAAVAYQYLLDCGISASSIVLCGESAGGGLCFALCASLAERGLPTPAGIFAVSPWVDLTLSGDSIVSKRNADVALSRDQLDFFVDCYLGDDTSATDPSVSPLFAISTPFSVALSIVLQLVVPTQITLLPCAFVSFIIFAVSESIL